MAGCPSVFVVRGGPHGGMGREALCVYLCFSHPLLARLVRLAPAFDPAGSRGVPGGSACVLPKYICVFVVDFGVCAAAHVCCRLFAAKLDVVHIWLNTRTGKPLTI